MKKIVCLLFSIIMVISLSACGGAKTPDTLNLPAIGDKIVTECGLENVMSYDNEAIADLYGLDVNDFTDSVSFAIPNGAFPDEVVIVEAANEDAKKRIGDAFQARIDAVMQQAQNYSPENYKLAQECKVINNGNYYALFISAKHADMEKIFADAAK